MTMRLTPDPDDVPCPACGADGCHEGKCDEGGHPSPWRWVWRAAGVVAGAAVLGGAVRVFLLAGGLR